MSTSFVKQGGRQDPSRLPLGPVTWKGSVGHLQHPHLTVNPHSRHREALRGQTRTTFPFLFACFQDFHIYLKGRATKKKNRDRGTERGRENALPPGDSLPKWATMNKPGPGWKWELGTTTKSLAWQAGAWVLVPSPACCPRPSSRRLDWEQCNWDGNQHLDMECQGRKEWLNLLQQKQYNMIIVL